MQGIHERIFDGDHETETVLVYTPEPHLLHPQDDELPPARMDDADDALDAAYRGYDAYDRTDYGYDVGRGYVDVPPFVPPAA